ncbi:cysteinyl-tRNA synthetase [Mucor velutinosus]|uniref:Cysteinyl-tRNA synthetase n=1 Tax=Mucor velutinosus TaxID=708070 RepID=A0AAN7HXN5_9FUNG|nr:cysteinyl-tRNA synthetase [Mucor velutinosus]
MYFQVVINSFSGFGPFCLKFKPNEPCTVYDLKQKLASTTTFSVEEQKIRSLGGRILTDNDNLFQDYSIQEGPIILNLTVRLIGGRDSHQSRRKKKACIDAELIQYNDTTALASRKGKEKESRKRKLA